MVTLEEPKKVTPGELCLTVPRKDPPTPETLSEPVTPLVGATWDSQTIIQILPPTRDQSWKVKVLTLLRSNTTVRNLT